MLYLAFLFSFIALTAGVLGFGVIVGSAASIAKVLFALFLVLSLIAFVGGRDRSGSEL